MSKRTRLLVILAVVTGLVVVVATVQRLGSSRADVAVRVVRNRSASAHVDMSQVLATIYRTGHDPVADALGLPSTDVSLSGGPSGWCASVRVRRLLSERRLLLEVSQGGLQPVSHCPRPQ